MQAKILAPEFDQYVGESNLALSLSTHDVIELGHGTRS